MISLHLEKKFRNGVTPFTLDVRYDIGDEHKCAVLFGPSGSGKSLTMQCLAGLIRPDAGHIRVGGCTLYDSAQNVSVSVQKRRIGYMFQDYALFPHLNLLQNVAYPRTGCWPWRMCGDERHKAQAMLERLGIGHLAAHLPRRFRAVRGNARRWPGRSTPTLCCCCSTSLFRPLILCCASGCVKNCLNLSAT